MRKRMRNRVATVNINQYFFSWMRYITYDIMYGGVRYGAVKQSKGREGKKRHGESVRDNCVRGRGILWTVVLG